jgi:glycosyltransferase involved in cell wall biosynthesis
VTRLAIVVSHPIQYQAPLYRLLRERGAIDFEVLFLSEHGLSPTYDEGFGRELRFDVALTEGFPHRFVPNHSPRSSVLTFGGLVNPRLVAALRPDDFDAVLIHGYAHLSCWIGFAAALGRRMPLLLRGETPDPPLSSRSTVRWKAKRALLHQLVRRADGIATIGLRNARYWLSLGATLDQLHWAPYSVEVERFRREGAVGAAQRRSLLEAIGLPVDRPVALFASKLSARKRVGDFLAVARACAGDASFLVIGDGDQRDDVEGAARTIPGIRWLGFVNQQEIARWYGVADVFVLPSEREPWGLAVNEAMAAGAVPVVTSDVGCAPDLVAGGAGHVVPVGDVEALEAAVVELLDPGVRDRARDEGRSRIERYDLDATARGIEQTVLGGPSVAQR